MVGSLLATQLCPKRFHEAKEDTPAVPFFMRALLWGACAPKEGPPPVHAHLEGGDILPSTMGSSTADFRFSTKKTQKYKSIPPLPFACPPPPRPFLPMVAPLILSSKRVLQDPLD